MRHKVVTLAALLSSGISILLSGCSEPAAPLTGSQYNEQELAIIQQARVRAHSCAACHGPAGISRQAMYPSLAGLEPQYFTQQLTAYRDGERKHALMSPQARGLSDQDIALLAEYYFLLGRPAEQ
ncbi:c-type cytochrome [Arsukibacterium sp.]|uniref:c-type cytochrome n=1 Tax=Arsukibacterium sp. TaxID=1977258 RepID=UPI002FD99946